MSPTDLCANTSGCSLASSTVCGSSGQPGAIVAYPASSKTVLHRSQLLGNSHNPWTKTTGCLPEALAAATCSDSYCLISAMHHSIGRRDMSSLLWAVLSGAHHHPARDAA